MEILGQIDRQEGSLNNIFLFLVILLKFLISYVIVISFNIKIIGVASQKDSLLTENK